LELQGGISVADAPWVTEILITREMNSSISLSDATIAKVSRQHRSQDDRASTDFQTFGNQTGLRH